MSESNLRQTINRKLKPFGHITAVENRVQPGTPDVHMMLDGVGCWIEYKFVTRGPLDEDKVLLVPHFIPQQRLWLREYAEAGGRCFVLLQIRSMKWWMLFEGKWAAKNLGRTTVQNLIAHGCIWEHAIHGEEIVEAMKGDWS